MGAALSRLRSVTKLQIIFSHELAVLTSECFKTLKYQRVGDSLAFVGPLAIKNSCGIGWNIYHKPDTSWISPPDLRTWLRLLPRSDGPGSWPLQQRCLRTWRNKRMRARGYAEGVHAEVRLSNTPTDFLQQDTSKHFLWKYVYKVCSGNVTSHSPSWTNTTGLMLTINDSCQWRFFFLFFLLWMFSYSEMTA